MDIMNVSRKSPMVTIDDIDFGKAFLFENELYMRTCCSGFNETVGGAKILEPDNCDFYIICVKLTDGTLVQLPYHRECIPVYATISYSL